MTSQLPFPSVSYLRAREACTTLLHYFMGLQASNPWIDPSREPWGALAEILDGANEWEEQNPLHDKETHWESNLIKREMEEVQRGIFTDEDREKDWENWWMIRMAEAGCATVEEFEKHLQARQQEMNSPEGQSARTLHLQPNT